MDTFQDLRESVSGGTWVEGALAGGALATEAAATVLDPFSALLSNGLGWAMEYFAPLREMLDTLAGLHVGVHPGRGKPGPVHQRPVIADLVARVIVWAAESLLVITIPVVAAQIASAVVKWAGRILGYTTSLITSLKNLTQLVEG